MTPQSGRPGEPSIELTILMPCLNEAETVGACVTQARTFLSLSGVSGEVLVADNGSTDCSRESAAAEKELDQPRTCVCRD